MNNNSKFAYHISDDYFRKAKDKNLMQNKENGNYRPTFYGMKDKRTSLLWMVPISSQVTKYENIRKKQMKKYGECDTLVFGKFDGRDSVFLVQNMFPIRECYIDHIHTRNGKPVPIRKSTCEELSKKMKKVQRLTKRGVKIVFPDIERLERIMLEEEREEATIHSFR